MPRPPDTMTSLTTKFNDIFGREIVGAEQISAPAVMASGITSLAGLGATIYLITKARWGLAALTFFIGSPVAAITVLLTVAAMTKKRA